ncbi:hypothetical protein J005_00935 [Cryptococcus neoformans]|nr:hypothetical protein J005_00935 [Cryptococcus neoformans var. grubii]
MGREAWLPVLILILTGFAQERRPGPLVRSALGVYRDIQFQMEMLLEQALDLSLRDVHAPLCPACFGPRESSDLPNATKEVYMAVDANFTHSRLKSSSKYDFSNIIPPSFLSKSHVSHAAEQYEESGADKVKVGKDSSACSDNWKAKDGGQKEGNYKTDTGFVAIPPKLAHVDAECFILSPSSNTSFSMLTPMFV